MTHESMTERWKHGLVKCKGPWLGNPLPGAEPAEFCPELLTSQPGDDGFCFGITFSPRGDEAFFTKWTVSTDRADLMHVSMDGDAWTSPQLAAFNSDVYDNDICLAPDGGRLVWRSWRALPGHSEPEKTPALWVADRTSGGWADPFPVLCDGETQAGFYPSFAANGSLYFSVRLSDDEYCIARARRDGNGFGSREILIRGLTSGCDVCVAPDESYLIATIFSEPKFRGVGNLHVSHQMASGEWTEPKQLDSLSTELLEYCVTLADHGRKLFFCRNDRQAGLARTFWVDSASLDALRVTS